MKHIPAERIHELRKQLDMLPARDRERKNLISSFADLYGVSPSTVYRSLKYKKTLKSAQRSDFGIPRKTSEADMERYCQIIAALKLRTNNKKGHHLSTSEAIRLLEDFGVETPEGLVKAPKGLLNKATVNRYIKKFGYSLELLSVQPIVHHFQAKYSNDCWQFDLSPSDMKDLPEWPEWVDQKKHRPVLMLYSFVDDRSGVAYQEYHVTYGEDVEAALRFLFSAMSSKNIEGFPFQGRPKMIYSDNGPVTRSGLFKRVLQCLDIELKTHVPKDNDGRRVTARSKGKVERPFRTVKEVHETLYHFHKPNNQEEANAWLLNYLLSYNVQKHRSEPHSRIEDWIKNIPDDGIREMCSWDRLCVFAREPDKRRVGPDARVSVNGVSYEVDIELAGRDVTIWPGLLDNDLYVESGDLKYGPYKPVGGPVPLNHFRAYKKTQAEKRADNIEELSKVITIPKEALTSDTRLSEALLNNLPHGTPVTGFKDPDPFNEITFLNQIAARQAISNYLSTPLAKLPENDLRAIDLILDETLDKDRVLNFIREHFKGRSFNVIPLRRSG